MDPVHAECRGLGHQWQHDVRKLGPNYYVVSTCQCGATKERTYNRHGWKMQGSRIRYPEGYLFKKGQKKYDKEAARSALFRGGRR